MGYKWPVRSKKPHKFNLDPNAPRGSKLERAVYEILTWREKSGEISDIKCQHSVTLGTETIQNYRTQEKRERVLRWKVDFSFIDNKTGNRVWCEAKGVEGPLYRRQLKMWRAGAGPGLLEIWKGDYRRPTCVEIVKP